MNLYGRILMLILKRLFLKNRVDLFGVCRTHFRVNPMDLDLNIHMNNGRYLSIMDLGRVDLMLQAGVLWPLFCQGYYPVVATECIRFMRPLGPFESFTVSTQIDSWDEKDIFLSQRFESKGHAIAEGYLKARFKKRGKPGSVSTIDLFEAMGIASQDARNTETGDAIKHMERSLGRFRNK